MTVGFVDASGIETKKNHAPAWNQLPAISAGETAALEILKIRFMDLAVDVASGSSISMNASDVKIISDGIIDGAGYDLIPSLAKE